MLAVGTCSFLSRARCLPGPVGTLWIPNPSCAVEEESAAQPDTHQALVLVPDTRSVSSEGQASVLWALAGRGWRHH